MSTWYGDGWPRAKEVGVHRNRLLFVLDDKRTYKLADAYRYAPHVQFINLKNNLELASFVRAFGPLYFVHQNGQSTPVTDTNIYWSFQRWLKSLVKLIEAFQESRSERESLLGFINADRQWSRDGSLALLLSYSFSLPKRPEQWIPKADKATVRKAMAHSIETSLHVRANLQAGSSKVTTRWAINTLQDALKWMVWYDVFRQNPVLSCQECGEHFRPETKHLQKYHSPKCAHRAAARESARRIRRKRGQGTTRKMKARHVGKNSKATVR